MDSQLAEKTSDVGAVDPTLGRSDAPVVVTVFADFRCPHCRVFEQSDVHRRLQEDYIEKGEARIVFVNFPVLGPDSDLAAEASHYVWRSAPEIYWAWHKRLFEANEDEEIDQSTILEMSVGFEEIDLEGLGQALESGAHEADVERNREMAEKLDVPGTPTILVDGKQVPPDQLLDAVRDARGR